MNNTSSDNHSCTNCKWNRITYCGIDTNRNINNYTYPNCPMYFTKIINYHTNYEQYN